MPIMTADEAVRYDPETGMMDISYASAWQIGRLLALQDKEFSVSLYNWKRSSTIETVMAFERQILEEEMGDTLELTANGHKEDPLIMHYAAANFIRKRLKRHLVKGAPEDDDPPRDPEGSPGGMKFDTNTVPQQPKGATTPEGG
ncbi:MAG: hypothetical protein KAR06_10865, partial [Deltaproteobacteria bacterium]|nr:hypothetical protein [Deltaproteobacteria bacterium]